MKRVKYHDNQRVDLLDMEASQLLMLQNLRDFISRLMFTGDKTVNGMTVQSTAVPSAQVEIVEGVILQSGAIIEIPVGSKETVNIIATDSVYWGTGSAPHATLPRYSSVFIKYATQETDSTLKNFYDPVDSVEYSQLVNTRESDYYDITVAHGTPSSTPTAPATPDGYIRLADIYVPPNSTAVNSANITDKRPPIVSSIDSAVSAVANHEAKPTGAHPATAISILDSGGYFSAINVENALQEEAARSTGHIDATAPHSGHALTSRTITAGSGLTGGGDLTANRTIAIADGAVSDTHIGTRAINQDIPTASGNVGTLTQIFSWFAKALKAHSGAANWYDAPVTNLATLNARTISAGTGLTGGGSLAADRTLSIASGGVSDTHIGTRTLDQSTAAPFANSGTISQILSWLVKQLKAITGGVNWYDAPAATLASLKSTTDSLSTSVSALNSRTISAGVGLAGGGSLAANRTISVATGGITVAMLAQEVIDYIDEHGGAGGGQPMVIKSKYFVATQGQTVLDISDVGSYTPNNNRTQVVVRGVPQKSGVGYDETSSTTVTLAEGLSAGDEAWIIWFEALPGAPTGGGGSGAGGAFVNLKLSPYSATGDGVADDYSAFLAAFTALGSAGGTIYLPAGTYRITNRLFLSASSGVGPISIIGDGDASVILIDDAAHTLSALYLSGMVGTSYKNFKVKSTVPFDYANRNASQQGMWILDSSDIHIDNVSCDTMAGTFILLQRCEDIKITNCTFKNTLSDGIHVTDKSKRITVTGNHGDTCGDDTFACVSYITDGDYCEDVTFAHNTVKNGKARGITAVGGKRVLISHNQIDTTVSSGILTNKDSNYGTYDVIDTIIDHNTLINPGQGTPKAGVATGNQHGIEMADGSVSVTCDTNTVRNAKARGIVGSGSTSLGLTVKGNRVAGCVIGYHFIGTSRLTFVGNRAENNTQYGGWFQNLTLSSFDDNEFYNNNTSSTAGADNANFNACSYCALTNNRAIDDRTSKLVERGIELVGCTYFKFGGNHVSQSDGTSDVQFIGASTNNMRTDGPVRGTGVPTSTIYAAGTRYYDTVGLKSYEYTGSGWVANT